MVKSWLGVQGFVLGFLACGGTSFITRTDNGRGAGLAQTRGIRTTQSTVKFSPESVEGPTVSSKIIVEVSFSVSRY